jgi:hypothetical protein
VGSSPIGFEGAPYLVGAARVGFRPAPAWNVGWEVARAPRTDTRAAWVGTVFPETRQLYGRVSHVWTAVEASAGGVGWDLGGVARVGYVEGIGVAPNPMAETVAWTGRTFGDPSARVQARFVRVGVDGIAMSYERREDGLVPGQGGYFSPGFFGSAMARVSGVSAGRGRALCGGLALGVRHQSAGDNVFDATGTGASVAANAGAAWRLGGDWRLQADARGERATTGWQQVAGLVRLTNGGRGTSVSPSPSALGAPGLGLPRPDELCDILP